MTLRDDFLWGAATASYQIEGAVGEDGRGVSIWDTFSHTAGKVRHGDTGDLACDSYHRLDQDLDLAADLGLTAYRFSVSWPRVQPEGRGRPHPAGLDYYRRLVDGLAARGIAPVVTLYHWDLPQALQDVGGWVARDTAGRFQDYAAVVAEALGEGVAAWATVNEPGVVTYQGHVHGAHAPGATDEGLAYAVAHHLLLAHGRALEVLADTAKPVMIALSLSPMEPADDRDVDVEAATLLDGLNNRLFLDAVLRGRYPDDVAAHIATVTDPSFVRDGDLDLIGRPVDALGVNYYFPTTVSADVNHPRGQGRFVPSVAAVTVAPGGDTTAMGWPVRPDAFESLLVDLHTSYAVPLYVTENGAAFDDQVGPDGQIDDGRRVSYLEEHLDAARRAVNRGVDLRGYFAWSLLDNFEWAEGYSKRFGLYHVDFPTQRRTAKRSALWYRDVIARNGDA